MSCKKRGFITISHNDLRDLTANFLSNVCNDDVEIAPKLLPVIGQIFSNRAENTRAKSRLDWDQGCFWLEDDKYSLIKGCLTHTLKDTLTHLFHNTTHKIKTWLRSRVFLGRGQQVFFDKRVFEAHAERHLNSSLPQYYLQNEKEKKRQQNERVLQIEHENSTLLLVSIYDGISHKLSAFYNRLSTLISKEGKYKLQ